MRDKSGIGNTMPHSEAIRRQRESMARFYLGTNLATDQKTIAERQWRDASKAPVAQRPLDIGLFSDDHLQTELFTAHKGK